MYVWNAFKTAWIYLSCLRTIYLKTRKELKKNTEDTNHIYQIEFDKACFQHDVAHGVFKDLVWIKSPDKVLRDKTFKLAKVSKYDGYQRGLASMVYIFLIKKPVHFQKNLLLVVVLNLYQINNLQMNFINQLGHFKKWKYIHHLETIFEVMLLLTCH